MKGYRRGFGAATALALLAALPGAAQAADPAFYGAWVITEARPAPWASGGDDAFSVAEQRRLLHSKVIYSAARIVAPSPLRCEHPQYRQEDVPPDYLFEGGLTDPAAQARALGFAGTTISTLETGCGADIAFHFVDAGTAMFGLNNRIYVMRKQ